MRTNSCIFVHFLIETNIFVIAAFKGHVSCTKPQLRGFHLPAVKSIPPDVTNMLVYDAQMLMMLSVNPL